MTTPTDMGEFYGLVGAHCDDTLSAEQAARLQTMLLQDAELRRRYVLCLHVQAATERSLAALLAPRGEAAIDAANCLPSAHRAEVGRRRGAGGEGKAASPVLGFLGNLSQIPGFTPALWTIAAILICTLTLACVIAIRGIHVHVDQPEVARSTEQGAGSTVQGAGSNNSPLPPAVPGRMGEGQGVRASSPVARLIHAADCRWAEESDAPEVGDDLAPGRKLVLRSGLAELMFTSGARALLQGPATLEVGSKTSALLRRGKVTVTVLDESARGFEIDTPGMKYTDLGTEFGVLVATDGMQEVHVFRGKVQAEEAEVVSGQWPVDSEKNTLPSPSAVPSGGRGAGGEGPSASHSPLTTSHFSPLILTANQAIRITAPDNFGRRSRPIERIAADETQFVRAMPAPKPEPFALFNTGVAVDHEVDDLHWQITAVSTDPKFQPRPAVVIHDQSKSVDGSRPISLNKPAQTMPGGCQLTFRTQFDLSDFDSATARIEGECFADDWVVQVRINGRQAAIPPVDKSHAAATMPLHIDDGFLPGRNALEIVVENAGAPGTLTPANTMCLWTHLKGTARRAVKPGAKP